MVSALDDQIAGAQAEIAGQPFVKQKERWMPTENGSKERRVVQSALRKFWFKNTQGQVLLEMRFGNKPLVIQGKPSILVGEMANLPVVLNTLREAVLAGELDSELAAASDQRRRGRKVKNGKPVGTTNATTPAASNGSANAKALFARSK
jgi:hypothetical protein